MSSWAPAPLRRLALTLVALVAVVVPGLVTAWVLTPSAADVQQRVRERTDSLGVVMLREDEVPKVLAQAVVATEDESFYSHHGIDSIGLGRALLYDASNLCLCQGGSTITEQLAKDVYLGGLGPWLQQAAGPRPGPEDRAGDRQAADPGRLRQRDPDGPEPLRSDGRVVRLFPRAAGQPDAGPVRAAGGRHAGAIPLRPHGRLRGGGGAAKPGPFGHGRGQDDLAETRRPAANSEPPLAPTGPGC